MTDYPNLFGDPGNDQWKQTPLGINYNAREFDRVPRTAKQVHRTRKRLNRALRWMIENKVPEYILNEFTGYFEDLPVRLPGWLDEAYSRLKETRWSPCVSRYPVLATIQPSDIRITLDPAPMWVPYWKKYACGMMEPDKSGAITLCVGAVTQANESSPELNWLRRVDRLARWEIGNYGAHYIAKLDARIKEIGDGPLC